MVVDSAVKVHKYVFLLLGIEDKRKLHRLIKRRDDCFFSTEIKDIIQRFGNKKEQTLIIDFNLSGVSSLEIISLLNGTPYLKIVVLINSIDEKIALEVLNFENTFALEKKEISNKNLLEIVEQF
jgi:hypothetical protein